MVAGWAFLYFMACMIVLIGGCGITAIFWQRKLDRKRRVKQRMREVFSTVLAKDMARMFAAFADRMRLL